MRNKDLRSKNWHLMVWGFFFSAYQHSHLPCLWGLWAGWKWGFSLSHRVLFHLSTCPKVHPLLGFIVMLSWQKGNPVIHQPVLRVISFATSFSGSTFQVFPGTEQSQPSQQVCRELPCLPGNFGEWRAELAHLHILCYFLIGRRMEPRWF